MSLPKPAKFPEWARLPYVDPVVGGSNIVEPAAQQKDTGWLRQQFPPGNQMNWIHNLTNEWLEYFDSVITENAIPVGAEMEFSNPVAATGWLVADDGTIGDAGSAATHAGAEFEALFLHYYGVYSDAICPVSGGRTTAAADWAANKTLKLPLRVARSVVAAGTAVGLTPRINGTVVGAEAVGMAEANNGPHGHPYTDNTVDRTSPANIDDNGNDFQSHAVARTTAPSGTGLPHENMQPNCVRYVHIKL